MQFSISHVLFQRRLGTTFFDNHLSTAYAVRKDRSFSSFSMPLPKFGLLAWGVYRVPPFMFP